MQMFGSFPLPFRHVRTDDTQKPSTFGRHQSTVYFLLALPTRNPFHLVPFPWLSSVLLAPRRDRRIEFDRWHGSLLRLQHLGG